MRDISTGCVIVNTGAVHHDMVGSRTAKSGVCTQNSAAIVGQLRPTKEKIAGNAIESERQTLAIQTVQYHLDLFLGTSENGV